MVSVSPRVTSVSLIATNSTAKKRADWSQSDYPASNHPFVRATAPLNPVWRLPFRLNCIMRRLEFSDEQIYLKPLVEVRFSFDLAVLRMHNRGKLISARILKQLVTLKSNNLSDFRLILTLISWFIKKCHCSPPLPHTLMLFFYLMANSRKYL